MLSGAGFDWWYGLKAASKAVYLIGRSAMGVLSSQYSGFRAVKADNTNEVGGSVCQTQQVAAIRAM